MSRGKSPGSAGVEPPWRRRSGEECGVFSRSGREAINEKSELDAVGISHFGRASLLSKGASCSIEYSLFCEVGATLMVAWGKGRCYKCYLEWTMIQRPDLLSLCHSTEFDPH